MSANEHRHEDSHGHGDLHGHQHGQHHGQHHGHAHAAPDFNSVFAIGMALNLGFVAIEAFYGWRIGSLALLADAAHNLSDVAGLGLAWIGTLAARWRPDARHTYGWKRAGIAAALANAVLLLVAMGTLAWEAAHRLGTPQAVEGWTMMAVAGVGIVVNGGTALLFMRGSSQDLNIRGAYLHMAADALVSAGVVVAGGLTVWLGWVWVDPVVSLVVAAVIIAGTWGLFKQSLHLMVDGVPAHIDLRAVHDQLAALPGVERVHDLHVWAMGTSEIALTAHLVMPSAPADDEFLSGASELLRRDFGIAHVTLQTMRVAFSSPCVAAV